ncbi:MAG: ATP-binding cassette domain-containing protein [Ignavibacteria bacterium]|nr:ATP-binding cassette domain-containing protein [Ignavibacteria bacterium]
MTPLSIEVRNFTKKFGEFTAVDNISFAVPQGSIFGFLGPNGAGKSTTISALCTIQQSMHGELYINGKNVDRNKDKVRADIGVVFQDSTLDKNLTVEENLKLHCDFYNVPKAEVKERIAFVLELVDLQDWRKAPVESLSGGMKRRAEIARGLVHYPRVLFLDEPTTGLDPQTRANTWDYIHKLQQQKNITIFLTTHYMEEAEICDKVAIIDHGKIVAHDTPDNLKKQYTSTTMRIKSTNPAGLFRYLDNEGIIYKPGNDMMTIYTTAIHTAIDIAAIFRDTITDMEIKKGTLNDVFIAITGKEIRE